MTQVTDRPSADYRARRAAMLLAQVREEQQRDAALDQVAPDATPGERAAVLRAWQDRDTADPAGGGDDPEDANTDGKRIEPGHRRIGSRRPRRRRRGKASDPATIAADTTEGPEPVPQTLATIPPPGRSTPRIGRTRSWVTRLLLLAGPLLLVGGLAMSCGVSMGSSRLVTPGAITEGEATQYHLSSFPTARAAAFATNYLVLCLTRPDPSDKAAVANRLAGLASMTSAGVTTGCGWTGATAEPPPAAVTFNGSLNTIPGYSQGAAAQLGFAVTSAGGRNYAVTVPVWVSSTATASGMRIVGDVAVMPATVPTPAPPASPAAVTDPTLAGSLTGTVLLPFLRAWSTSDPVQLGLVLAPDATASARTGLNGQLTDPRIANTQIVVVSGDPRGYQDGDRIQARLGVDWTAGAATQRTGYQIALIRVAGRWQVQSVAGAAPDPAGGAAAVTTPTQPAAG